MKQSRLADTRGLYAVTPEGLEGADLLGAVAGAVAGGALLVQYRAKSRADRETAQALAGICRERGALFIVNDDPELAAAVDADGVHLGRGDVPIEQARARLGPGGIIGVSCYDDLQRAETLNAQGADYLAFGSMFASPTKPDAVRCTLSVLTAARRFEKPLVAIGGIKLERAADVVAAGADFLAVVSDLFDAPDVKNRAIAYSRLFEPPP